MTQPALRALSPETVAQFQLNGFLKVENVLSADQVAALGDHADLIAAGEAKHIPDTSLQLEPVFRDGTTAVADRVLATRKLFNMAVYDELLWQHATNPAVVDIVADLLGTDDIKMYGDQLFMKSPVTGSAQPWHQDSASWRDIFPMDLVTAWTAIDDATLDNGCLRFVPGHAPLGDAVAGAPGPPHRRPGDRAVAGGAGAGTRRQHQLPPQPEPAHQQQEHVAIAPSRLRHPLHARQFVAGHHRHRRTQDASVQAGTRTLVP